MNVIVKNTFLVAEDVSVTEEARRNQRRNKTLPREWKPTSLPNSCACSDASTDYSPRSSLVSSSEDDCIGAPAVSCRAGICPCASRCIDAKTQAVTSCVHSLLLGCVPAQSVKIEESTVEQDRKVLICVEAKDGTLAVSRCYQLMQRVKEHLSGAVAHSEGLSLLSARVQKEDYGYSLRSSVLCIPKDKEHQMCWNVLQRGSCPRRKFCQWYHPQPCDVVKFKVVIRCCGAKVRLSSAAA